MRVPSLFLVGFILGACVELQAVPFGTDEFEIRWHIPFEPSNKERFAADDLGEQALVLCPRGYEKTFDGVEKLPKKVFIWRIRCLD